MILTPQLALVSTNYCSSEYPQTGDHMSPMVPPVVAVPEKTVDDKNPLGIVID
jgi:hypothetical protein